MKRLLCLAFLALSLAGCVNFDNPAVVDDAAAVQAEVKGQEFLDKIGQFTLADLNQAMILAGDKDINGVVDEGVVGDQLADQCWFYLAGKVAAAGAPENVVTVAGVVSGFQAARNLKRQGGLSDEFKAACGGIILDVRGDILKMGIKGLPLPGLGSLPLLN